MRTIPHHEGRHVAMPLGGVGTGNVSICADGALRQWQLFDVGNHRGDLPYSFFALRVCQPEPPINEIRILQAPPALPEETRTPLTSDDYVPDWQRDLVTQYTPVQATSFSGTYPFGRVDYHDHTIPVGMTLQAFTPMHPLDVNLSSLPVAMFEFTVTNLGDGPVHGWIGAGVQNPVGGSGAINPAGCQAPGYGGNDNHVVRREGVTSLIMENESVPPDDGGAGRLVLSSDAPITTALARWTDPAHFVDFLAGRHPYAEGDWDDIDPTTEDFQPSGPVVRKRPSPEGSTWNGGLAAQFNIEPGEVTTIRFSLVWSFPNRYASFTQHGGIRPEWSLRRWNLGNHYADQHPDAAELSVSIHRTWQELEKASKAWVDILETSSLNQSATEHLAAQASIVRSPSFFRIKNGSFFGFEGVCGDSTVMWSGDVGGSCPLNCTHVFGYAQGLAKLFPELERNMRQCEFEVMQAPDGSIPHRVIVPTHLPQIWDRSVGGPSEPALDGMLTAVLKTYREVRNGAGLDWLVKYWPNLTRVMTHITDRWDPDDTGMLHGIQPTTHDIDLAGLNPYIGGLWLAALRASEEMAGLVGDEIAAAQWAARFHRGGDEYDKRLFNGEYYEQVLEDGDPTHFQWETGCLSDQLIGQWWAHLLDLGYLWPDEHVKTALQSVVRYNLYDGFEGFDHPYRVFAAGDESGLVMCTWPRGGRPEIPTRYCDEVWTGSEYQVAAHSYMEGLSEEAQRVLEGLWGRYDGRRRNPYNQIECGDHYIRALAGWSVLEAITGQRWDAVTRALRFNTLEDGTVWPVVLNSGWGQIGRHGRSIHLTCYSGHFDVDDLQVGGEHLIRKNVRVENPATVVLDHG